MLLESPLWLHANDRSQQATQVLLAIARVNGRAPPPAFALEPRVVPEKEPPVELFGAHARLTLLLAVQWFAASFAYYGPVFVLPMWFHEKIGEDAEYAGVLLSAAAEARPGWRFAAETKEWRVAPPRAST